MDLDGSDIHLSLLFRFVGSRNWVVGNILGVRFFSCPHQKHYFIVSKVSVTLPLCLLSVSVHDVMLSSNVREIFIF